MPAELTHLLEFVEGWRSSSCHALLFSSPMPQPPSTLEGTSSRNASHCCVHFCSRFLVLRLWPSLSSARRSNPEQLLARHVERDGRRVLRCASDPPHCAGMYVSAAEHAGG